MASNAVSAPLRQLPNVLTLLRVVLIPVFVGVLLAADGGGASWPAGIIFGVAGVTDQVDGWLARRWHVESQFGKLADPLADRLMIDAAIVLLWLDGKLPWPGLAVILFRDVLLVGGYRLVVPRGYEFAVTRLGKLATWLLYSAIGCVLVTSREAKWPEWLFWAGLALAVVAGIQYLLKARREVGRGVQGDGSRPRTRVKASS